MPVPEKRFVFFVQNVSSRQFLREDGTWASKVSGYKLATFDTEEAAEAAFPNGANCVFVRVPVRGDK